MIAKHWRRRLGPLALTHVKLPRGARQLRITWWGKTEVRDLRLHCRYLSGADRDDFAMAEPLIDEPDSDWTARQTS